jgi:sigma-B regulation protein RsbU (phosphoserine phosphatase)
MRPNGTAEQLAPTGLVLGVSSDWAYTSGVIELGHGDRLVCYTDGITEALAPDDGEFGEERLIETIRSLRAEPPDRLARAVSDAVAAWTGGSPQDDATLIVAAIDNKKP